MKARRLPFEVNRVDSEQVIEAYRETGSVWKAGKRLGVSGQSVWERLRALGVPMGHQTWSEDELAELAALAGQCTIGEIATRLGRAYAAVACKISEQRLGSRYGNRQQRTKKTRGGYSVKRVRQLIDALEAYGGSIRSFCRQQGLDLEYFIQRVQTCDRAFWDDYTRRKSDLTAKVCPYCGTTYYPMTKRQQSCSRVCAGRARTDRQYFGGKRREAIGLIEGICQLCMAPKSILSAHHVIGKQNDPDNAFLIALCAGCHQLVGMLASRLFADSEEGWENLISLVLSRRLADKNRSSGSDFVGVHSCVDLDWLTRDDLESLEAS
jgi:hypothetical protein